MQENKQGRGSNPQRLIDEQTWDVLTQFGSGAGQQYARKAIVRNPHLFDGEDVAEARPLSEKFLPDQPKKK